MSLYDVGTQNNKIFILTAMKTSNLTEGGFLKNNISNIFMRLEQFILPVSLSYELNCYSVIGYKD
jgi:hypothetical protein